MAVGDDEVKVRAERARAIGLFRYQLIREAADPAHSTKERGKMVRELASREHTDPFGRKVRISRQTIDRWIRDWRAGGFDALVPNPRQCTPRTPAEVLELAVALRRENPERTAAAIRADLANPTGWAPDERTLQRTFPPAGAHWRPAGVGAGGVRPVRSRPTRTSCGSGMLARSAGRRPQNLPFRFLRRSFSVRGGYRFGFSEDTVRLAAALRPALAARGVPTGRSMWTTERPFVDAWLLRACAKLGVRLVHSQPGRPQGRGKIERFFRTVREQFLVEVTAPRGPHSAGVDHATALLELNRLFVAWTETEYHRRTIPRPGTVRWPAGSRLARPGLPPR